MLSPLHPDCEYTTSGAFPGFDPVYRGREGMARFRRTMLEAWETVLDRAPSRSPSATATTSSTLGSSARGSSSGVDVTLEFHHVGRMRDGKVIRLVAGATREQALEASPGCLSGE